MKRILALILALLMLTAALVGCGNTPDQSNDNNSTDNTETPKPMSFKAGFGKQLIDVSLDESSAKGFYDKLYTSCTAVRDTEDVTVLFITVDAFVLSGPDSKAIREDISKETGVDVANILINHSHSHYTPQYRQNAEPKNYKALHDACIDAAKIAIHDLADATISTGVIETEGMISTRRFIDKNGNGRYEPQTNNEIEYPVDENVYVIKFDREGKKDIVLASLGAHSTVSSGADNLISSSFFGPCREEFEKKLNKDAYLALFQGAAGNSIPRAWVETSGKGIRGDGLTWDPDFIGSDSYGQKLAKYISECLENNMTEQVSEKGLRVSSRTLTLAVDKTRDADAAHAQEILNEWSKNGASTKYYQLCEKYNIANDRGATKIVEVKTMGAASTIEINTVAIGNFGILATGYEILSATEDEMRELSPFDFTFVLGYTNGHHAYIPNEAAFENGQMEVYMCYYFKGSAEKIRDLAIKMLNKLAE